MRVARHFLALAMFGLLIVVGTALAWTWKASPPRNVYDIFADLGITLAVSGLSIFGVTLGLSVMYKKEKLW